MLGDQTQTLLRPLFLHCTETKLKGTRPVMQKQSHSLFYLRLIVNRSGQTHLNTKIAYFISLCPHTFLDKLRRSLAYFSSIDALKEKVKKKVQPTSIYAKNV